MKRFLLPALAVILAAQCGLCLFQWKREADFRAALAGLSARLLHETQAGEEARERLVRLQAEIQRIEALRSGTEAKYLAAMEELVPLQADWTARGLVIKALAELEDRPAPDAGAAAQQNAAILRQNALLKSLAGERDAAIEKLNARTREWNALTEKYNQLVKSRG